MSSIQQSGVAIDKPARQKSQPDTQMSDVRYRKDDEAFGLKEFLHLAKDTDRIFQMLKDVCRYDRVEPLRAEFPVEVHRVQVADDDVPAKLRGPFGSPGIDVDAGHLAP